MFKLLVNIEPFIIKIFSGIISIFIFSVCFISQPTYACEDHGNSVLKDGCSHLDIVGSPGAAWINGRQEFSYSESATVDNPDESSITVYLHGALYNYAPNSENWANNVRLCTKTNGNNTRSSTNNQCDTGDKPDYITSYAHTFFRGYGRSGDWSTGQGDRSGYININLNKFKSAASRTEDGNYDKYTAGVWIARCPNTSSNSGCGSGTTYRADYSIITIRIKSLKTTTYSSRTTATTSSTGKSALTTRSGWDGYKSDTYTLKEGQTKVKIKFVHEMERTDNEAVSSKGIYWRLTNPSAGRINGINTDWKTVNFSGKNDRKTLYTMEKEFTVRAGTTETFCQGVNHERIVKVYKNGNRASSSRGSTATSEVCITVASIYNPPDADPPSSGTKIGFIGEDTSITKGSTSTAGATAQTVTFFVNKGQGTPSSGAVNNSKEGGERWYAEGESKSAPADPGYPNSVCSYYSIPKMNCDNASSTVAIPDNENTYLGAKVCAAAATRFVRWNGRWGTRVKETITRKDKDGNTVTENIMEDYQIYDYYWEFGNASCSPIAKKPNTRITNSGVFSSGSIKTTASTKTNGSVSGKTFGSWAEYLTVAGGTVSNFGSGASLSVGSSTNGLKDNSPLTISNNSDAIGNSKVTLSDSFISGIRSRFINSDNYDHNQIYVDKSIDGTYEITRAKANEINNSGKLNIIYAKNIHITKDVSTIRAWIFADGGTIDTCFDYMVGDNKLSANECNTKLTINGLVYASQFKLTRTYGAGSGLSSTLSAENIELTADNYRRAYSYANSNYSQPMEVYSRELAPRS